MLKFTARKDLNSNIEATVRRAGIKINLGEQVLEVQKKELYLVALLYSEKDQLHYHGVVAHECCLMSKLHLDCVPNG
jgi:hypothetical protein